MFEGSNGCYTLLGSSDEYLDCGVAWMLLSALEDLKKKIVSLGLEMLTSGHGKRTVHYSPKRISCLIEG